MKRSRGWRWGLLGALALIGLAALAATRESATPPADRRGEEQTFLTFPEWFLVHSPAEFAAYLKQDRAPSAFPWWGHIDQLWSSYGKVTAASRAYPFNGGYHVMIVVIASSTTVEYALRSTYETLVGRLGELARTHGPTNEDRYAAAVAQDYVDFIRVRPWYEYDFVGKLKGLWRDTGLTGPDLLRKWERKYALTTEYAVKAAYGWLITKATRTAYEPALPTTAVVLDPAPVMPPRGLPDFMLRKTLPDGALLATVPRYEAFKRYAQALADGGAGFREIAGNPTQARLLLSLLVPRDSGDLPPGASVLFEQPLLTQPTRKRVALVATVGTLASTLRHLHKPGLEVEHIYDY